MSQDAIAAYESAVDVLVDRVEFVPYEDRLGSPDLVTAVDGYADGAGVVFDQLLEEASTESAYERLFALAAGDFRLAAALALAEEPSPADEAEARELAADVEAIREAVGDLRDDMAEVKAAVRGEPEGTDDEGGGPLVPRPEPPRGPSRANIPPLNEIRLVLARGPVETSGTERPEPVGARGRPVSGAGDDSIDQVQDAINSVVKKASDELTDLAVGGSLTIGVRVASEFAQLLDGSLGDWYGRVIAKLSGWAQRAKRAAFKLLYEGIDKLVSVLRSVTPSGGASAENVLDALVEVATWLANFAVRAQVKKALERMLRVPALRSHAETTFAALEEDERAKRASRVCKHAKKYKDRKFPMVYARVGIRVVRVLRLQHAFPPYGEVAVGCTILALCGVSGWMAQDALDHPELRFVPRVSKGIRSAIDGA